MFITASPFIFLPYMVDCFHLDMKGERYMKYPFNYTYFDGEKSVTRRVNNRQEFNDALAKREPKQKDANEKKEPIKTLFKFAKITHPIMKRIVFSLIGKTHLR